MNMRVTSLRIATPENKNYANSENKTTLYTI